MFLGSIVNLFPIITIISSLIVIITGVLFGSKDAIIAGSTVAGIAGTAYNSIRDSKDEDISITMQEERREPPSLGDSE